MLEDKFSQLSKMLEQKVVLGLRQSLADAGVCEPYHADIYGFEAQIGRVRAREGVRKRIDEHHRDAASAMAGD